MSTTTTTTRTGAAVRGVEDAVLEAVRVLGAARAAQVVRDAGCAAGFDAYSTGERREAVRRLSQMGGAR